MGKRLIVAEKPSVGRDIARVLGCKDRAEGAICGENDVVTWAYGHLVSQCYPEEMDDKYKEWTMRDLPILPDPFQLKVLESGKKQFETIRTWMHDPQIDRIVCATDAGREGELIFRYIYQMAECHKPVDRLWISSLTFGAIKRGFENLRSSREYDDLYQSARCRSEADWLIGINGSRAFAIANEMYGLSVGRVLSPTLTILVRREMERRKFVPEEYCELIGTFEGYEARLVNPEIPCSADTWSRFSMDRIDELKQFTTERHETATVISYTEVEETKPPQQLYDLTSLQRDANRIFGYSSKYTLDTAQKLYERHKAITYPRTDSRFLSSDIKSTLTKRLENLCEGEWKSFAQKALKSERDLFGRFILNRGVSDHHAIIPTGEAKDIEAWSTAERQIYDLIARRFIGMFLPDRIARKQRLETAIGIRTFRSQGEIVLQEGWSAVDRSRKSTLKELPAFSKGDEIRVQNMRVRTDQTKPPTPHTEATLLNAMEHAGEMVAEETKDDHETDFGIGTPATRAAIIEKLIEKQMAFRKGRALIPTEYGIRLIEILPEFLRSPEMTGEWEARLSGISDGMEDPDEFMYSIRDLAHELVRFAAKQGNTGIQYADSVGVCPLCGQHVIEYPDSYYCENKECGFRRIWKAVKGFHPTLQSKTMRQLLKEKKAVTEQGTYTLIGTDPYIAFERAAKPTPQYDELFRLIYEYDMHPVDKIDKGGGLWFEGGLQDERMCDFAADCSDIGCQLKYAKDSKALHHKSGWYLAVDVENIMVYKEARDSQEKDMELNPAPVGTPVFAAPTSDDLVLKTIIESGIEYVDKRSSNGNLWIISDAEPSRDLVKECARLGVSFTYSRKGGKATGGRPGWYAKW